jgi:hypothetical protein
LKGLCDVAGLPTEFHFYTADGQRVRVKTTGIDPGFGFEMRSDAIAELPLSGITNDDLYTLWDRGDEALLESVCRRILTGNSKRPSLLARLKGNGVPFSEALATFYLAACRIEGGDKKGWQPFDDWSGRYIADHKSEHYDVWRYHVLRRRLQGGDRSIDTTRSLRQTFSARRGRRIAVLLDQFKIDRPPKPDENRWRFPVHYEFPSLLEPGRVGSLAEKLSKLRPHQVHLVAVMQTYRTNAVYSDFCVRFREIHRELGEFVTGCDIITEDDGSFVEGRPQESDRKWMEAEEHNLAHGLPQEVLFDPRRSLFPTLKAGVCPTVYAVSSEGMVVKQGWEFFDIWEALARCSG